MSVRYSQSSSQYISRTPFYLRRSVGNTNFVCDAFYHCARWLFVEEFLTSLAADFGRGRDDQAVGACVLQPQTADLQFHRRSQASHQVASIAHAVAFQFAFGIQKKTKQTKAANFFFFYGYREVILFVGLLWNRSSRAVLLIFSLGIGFSWDLCSTWLKIVNLVQLRLSISSRFLKHFL